MTPTPELTVPRSEQARPRGGRLRWRDRRREQRTVTAMTLKQLGDRPVTGACLVGAIVQAGGGLAAVRSQPVQRALDLTWHTLHGNEHEPVHWCPAPPVRAAHVQDLTRWNDQPHRTSAEVVSLLHAVEAAAGAEIERAGV